MPKQTLQQKIRRALGRFTAKRIAMILLGAAILSFGIHNIHQRTAITEGGVIGLVLLINHWLGVPASVASPLLDAASYALAFKFLGWDFLLSAGVASVSLAGFYRIWECLPPMLPDLTPWPLAAALLGGVFVGVGVGLIVRQGVPVGVIVTLVLFARQFSEPLEQISNGLSTLQQAKAAAKRVVDLLELPEEAPIEQELPAGGDGSVEFRHVDFSYEPDTELIQDLNLHVEKGQHVAIVGPTGAGKTTIVNLLMRFYDVDSGSILLSGRDIADYSRASTRDRFGMVLQDTWLFGGTIAENVAFGKPDATREEIIRACDEAYCDHFIRTLPQGYDTVIGSDTSSISSGQKQLLTIARALLAQRELLILDEATSNVDTRTELLIQKAMDRLMRGRTCFIIAHRLSTIVDADLILVLRDGRIVEQGKHRDLLEKKGFYYEIYKSQYDIA